MTSTANRPTKKQKEILNFIESFIAGNGYGPSYREIRSGLGYSSVATIATHIDNLILKGWLKKTDNRARSLELTKPSTASPSVDTEVSASQQKWLVDLIAGRFKEVEKPKKPSAKAVDELYVLVGSLKVLGLEAAANSFIPRLSELNKILKKD